MKTLLRISLLIIGMQAVCSADIFTLRSVYEPKSKQWIEVKGERAKLIEKVGSDPVVNSSPAGKKPFNVVYGRLLGVREGEAIGSTERGITNDEIRVQVLSGEGVELGKPIRATVAELHPIPYLQTIDTMWDLERMYGSIARSFDTEVGSAIFETTLMGILDPSGEMGLNKLKAKVNLPDDFTHGWLTHYAFVGMDQEYSNTDIYSLDAVNAFSYLFIEHRVIKLIDDLALDKKFGIYEKGVRPEVVRFISLLYRFQEIDPARVTEPKLVERAKRLRALAKEAEWLLVSCLLADSGHAKQQPILRGRPVTPVERANAFIEVIDSHPDAFALFTNGSMRNLLNAGLPGRQPARYPHLECAEVALDLYFNFMEMPAMTGNRERDRRLRDTSSIRRRAGWSGMIPGGINNNAGFAARSRAFYKRIGYGTTAEIKDLVDSIDGRIDSKYMAELLYNKRGFMPGIRLDSMETLMPTADRSGPARNLPNGISTGSLSDEAFLHTSLEILKDIAFNLPENAIGRANKAAMVENWRVRQLDELQKSLDEAIRGFDDPPPELSADQKYFKKLITEQWRPSGAVVQP